MTTHLLIPDAQVKDGVPTEHLLACGRLIMDRKPDVVVNIGDFWDLPSLSSYDKGTLHAEGGRLADDIRSGNLAMDLLMKEYRQYRIKGRQYKPRLVFTLGNHEQRLDRHVVANPHLEAMFSYSDFNLALWEVHDFLKIVEIDGIHYSHYFANPMSGRPFGGTMQNIVNKLGFSFTMGHQQKLDFHRKDMNNGKAIQGLVAGAFYQHNERYKGPQGNDHWRGVILKHDVKDGCYDMEIISMERLLKQYL